MPRVREAQQIEGAKRHGAIVPPVANETFWGLGASTSCIDDKFDEIGQCVRLAALGQVNNHNVHVALCCQFHGRHQRGSRLIALCRRWPKQASPLNRKCHVKTVAKPTHFFAASKLAKIQTETTTRATTASTPPWLSA